jgi:hypothetical protein
MNDNREDEQWECGERDDMLLEEIAQLKRQLTEARAALLLIAKHAPSTCALLMADESFAAALRAAKESK